MESCSNYPLNLKIAAQSGFTMVELMLVVLIMGILAHTGFSRFFKTDTYNQDVYDNEVRTTIRYARKLAIATNGYVQVSVSSTSITLNYASICGSSATFTNVVDPLTNDNSSSYVRTAPGTVTLNYPVASGVSVGWPIYFNGTGQMFVSTAAGACSSGNNMTINVVGQPTMTIYAQTGFLQ